MTETSNPNPTATIAAGTSTDLGGNTNDVLAPRHAIDDPFAEHPSLEGGNANDTLDVEAERLGHELAAAAGPGDVVSVSAVDGNARDTLTDAPGNDVLLLDRAHLVDPKPAITPVPGPIPVIDRVDPVPPVIPTVKPNPVATSVPLPKASPTPKVELVPPVTPVRPTPSPRATMPDPVIHRPVPVAAAPSAAEPPPPPPPPRAASGATGAPPPASVRKSWGAGWRGVLVGLLLVALMGGGVYLAAQLGYDKGRTTATVTKDPADQAKIRELQQDADRYKQRLADLERDGRAADKATITALQTEIDRLKGLLAQSPTATEIEKLREELRAAQAKIAVLEAQAKNSPTPLAPTPVIPTPTQPSTAQPTIPSVPAVPAQPAPSPATPVAPTPVQPAVVLPGPTPCHEGPVPANADDDWYAKQAACIYGRQQ